MISMIRLKGLIANGSSMAQRVPTRWRDEISRKVGIRPPLKNIENTTIFIAVLCPLRKVLDRGYANRIVMIKAIKVPKEV